MRSARALALLAIGGPIGWTGCAHRGEGIESAARAYLAAKAGAGAPEAVLLMRGITPADDWTHLLPGMVVSGIGAGLVNVPLASTAVGVVEPARAGMASGINSTFRQIGIATGVAALGSILATQAGNTTALHMTGTPLAARSHQLAEAVSNGSVLQAIQAVPIQLRGIAAGAAKAGYVDGLNTILLIGAVVALAAAALTLVLIRQRDFVGHGAPGPGAPAEPQTETPRETVTAG